MITKKPTHQMLEEWRSVWHKYKDVLKPNRKSGEEIIYYLSSRYALTEINDKSAYDVIFKSVMSSEFLKEKLPAGAVPVPKTYYVLNQGNGEKLYQQKDEAFSDVERIFVGIDLLSGYYHVEGSSLLWDELCAFQGLDEADLKNYVKTAQYIECLERFGLSVSDDFGEK